MPPKILAVKLRALGDTVIWTASLKALHQRFPDSPIDVLTLASNKPLLQGLAGIHQIHTLPSGSRWDLVRTLFSLRSQRYDWLLGFHATTRLCRWAWVAGARQMYLHHHSWAHRPWGSRPLPEPAALEPAIERDLKIPRALGWSAKPPATEIALSAAEKDEARKVWSHHLERVGGRKDLPLRVVLPGASYNLKRYPRDLLLKVMDLLRQDSGVQTAVLLDSALENEWQLKAQLEAWRIPVISQVSLREFVALISCAQRALSNDSGPGHMAVAVGVPTTFLFGPSCVGDWHVYDRARNPLLRARVDCRTEGPRDREAFQFCTVTACSHHSCLRQITPEEIARSVSI